MSRLDRGGSFPATDPYTADGHRLTAHVEDRCITVHLHCPGPEHCKAPVEHASAEHEHECNLKTWFDGEGWHDFAEWQETPYREAEMPCEIEWRFTGWDDACELWWRPVVVVVCSLCGGAMWRTGSCWTCPTCGANIGAAPEADHH